MLIEEAKKHGLNRYINLVFTKNFSAQVLKANMRVVGNCEYGLILYRDKLPKFNNNGRMVFNAMEWPRDNDSEKNPSYTEAGKTFGAACFPVYRPRRSGYRPVLRERLYCDCSSKKRKEWVRVRDKKELPQIRLRMAGARKQPAGLFTQRKEPTKYVQEAFI